jgi:hypothetical protein
MAANNRDMPQGFPEPKKAPADPVKPLREGIKVMAKGIGFFRGIRYKYGEEFIVPSLDKVGSWMRCVEPEAHKEHMEFLRNEAKKLKEQAGR